MMACQKEQSVTLTFGPAPLDYGATFSTSCGVEDEGACLAIPAAGATIDVEPVPSESSEECPFLMAMT